MQRGTDLDELVRVNALSYTQHMDGGEKAQAYSQDTIRYQPIVQARMYKAVVSKSAFALTVPTDQLCFAVLRVQWEVAPVIGLTIALPEKTGIPYKTSPERGSRRLRQGLRFLRRLLVTNRHAASNEGLPETVVQCRAWVRI